MAFIVSDQALFAIPYPWQHTVWERLQQQLLQKKTPHAILLAGPQGIGKRQFAHAFANFLLCTSPRSALACGQCRPCQLIVAGTHPDKKICQPEEGSKTIKIEQIRELSAFVTKTAQQGGKKVVILGPVEQLNINAANALLKNLEEPAGDTVFILVTHVVGAVMATIRSRCQLLPLPMPSVSSARQWLETLQIDQADMLLELAGGAPLTAKAMAQGDMLDRLGQFIGTLDSIATEAHKTPSPDMTKAADWLSLDIQDITQWWLRIIHGMLTSKAPIQKMGNGIDQEIGDALNRLLALQKTVNRQWLFKFSDKLVVLRKQALQGANPNMQLLIEELLLDWHLLMRQA